MAVALVKASLGGSPRKPKGSRHMQAELRRRRIGTGIRLLSPENECRTEDTNDAPLSGRAEPRRGAEIPDAADVRRSGSYEPLMSNLYISTDVTGADLLLSLRSAEVTSPFFPPRAVSMLGESTRHQLLCVSARAEHQILYARQAPGETVPRAPSEARVASDPTGPTGACRAVLVVERYAFSSAPSGTIPCST